MIEAPRAPNESLRLDALRRTRLLDTPLEERFERLTRLAQRALGTSIAALTLVDSDRQWFKSVQGTALQETPRSVSFCAHVLCEDKLLEVSDARLDPRFHDNPLVTGDPHAVFYAGCLVLSPDGYRVGVLCVLDFAPRTLLEEERQTLFDLAAVAESELRESLHESVQNELLRQLDDIRRRGQVDSLTRLWNRDFILELLDAELARPRRSGAGVGAILADVDFFKQINDSHGHAAGDEVLRQTGVRMLGAIRETDALGRFGGEEFLVVLGGCSSPLDVTTVAERIRSRFAERPIRTEFGDFPLTVSLGAVHVQVANAFTGDQIVRSADAALYAAKRAGRNRATCVQL